MHWIFVICHVIQGIISAFARAYLYGPHADYNSFRALFRSICKFYAGANGCANISGYGLLL
jgi:hypothetical protein